jgi:SAM-dependent methyltransferase
MLELGTGAGIAAIMGARHARRVWATDIATRAVQFASLSCRLAGLDNVTVLEGDLYHPVEGLTFDRIAFHPPWIPAAQSSFVFGNGGEDGETIIRGAIEELPRFLRPGGRFYATLLASDREGERFEQRVRRWLGAAQDQFDIAVAELSCASPNEFLAQNLARGSIGESEIPLWTELWRATRTEAVLYAHLIVQRHASDREPATARGPSWVPNRLSGPA